MPERTVYLNDWQVQAALEDRLGLLYIPMRKQPPEGVEYRGYYAEEDTHLWAASFVIVDEWPIAKAPYAPGDTLLGQEAWLTRPDPDPELGGIEIKYRATDNIDAMLYGGWRSPTHMPREAVRIKFTVKSVAAVQVCKMMIDVMIAAGIVKPQCGSSVQEDRLLMEIFTEKWQSRYGKRYPWDEAWAWKLKVKG